MNDRNQKPLVVAIANEKGGVLKSTTAVHLAASLARRGVRVCLVDLDAQLDASEWITPAETVPTHTIWDLFSDVTRGIGSYATPVEPGLDVVYGSRNLARIESIFAQVNRPLNMLRTALKHGVERYDLVIIDCPPSVGRTSLNAFVSADEVIIPITPGALARKGLKMVLTSISNILGDDGELEKAPQIRVLRTRYDSRLRAAKHSKLVVDQWGIPMFETVIRPDAKGEEAFDHRETLFVFDPTGKIATDYEQLSDEYLTLHPELLAIATGVAS